MIIIRRNECVVGDEVLVTTECDARMSHLLDVKDAGICISTFIREELWPTHYTFTLSADNA